MGVYEWRWINHPEGYGSEFEIDGRIVPGTVTSADPLSTGFSALVEVEEETTEGTTSRTEDREDPECGYNGCSRGVSDPEERCWQHEDE